MHQLITYTRKQILSLSFLSQNQSKNSIKQ